MVKLRDLQTIAARELSGALPTREINTVFSLLAEYHLGWNRTEQLLKSDENLIPEIAENILNNISEIKSGRPVQHITGIGWFLDMPFKVNSDVLIPRPETEELVIHASKSVSQVTNPIILDICSGSGCIAISLKKLIPGSTVRAIEVSENAMAIARQNERDLLSPDSDQIHWINADALVVPLLKGDEDLVISNPPYIPANELEMLPENVRNFEPHFALFSPTDDPLLFYRVISKSFAAMAKIGAQLWFECHEDYSQQLAELLITLNLKEVKILNDMQKKPRMVMGKKLDIIEAFDNKSC